MDVPDGLAAQGLESLIELCGFGIGIFCLIGAVAAAQRKDWSEFHLTAFLGIALTWFSIRLDLPCVRLLIINSTNKASVPNFVLHYP